MHRVPYCLQVPSCQFMSGPIYAYFQSIAYTRFDKDTATPNEKDSSLTFPDPILGLWGGTCQSEITSCN